MVSMTIIIINSYTHFNNTVYQSICNVAELYDQDSTDICVLNKNTTLYQYNATNIMVIKQNTGEIKYNQTLYCYAPYTPILNTPNQYCLDMVYYNNLNQSLALSSNAIAIVKWMFPNKFINFKQIFECKYDPYVQTYVQPEYMKYLCKDKQQSTIIVWVYLIICIAICVMHAESNNYPYIINDPATLNRKLTVKAECGITYEPIADDQTYYKCVQCTAVYDYDEYYKYWLSSKKCAYCAVSVPLTPTQFKNAP